MKTAYGQALLAAAVSCVLMATPAACSSAPARTTLTHAQAPQIPIPTTAAEVPGPAPGTAMTTEYVQMVGRMAYLWGWPLMNTAHRHAAFSRVPEPGLMGGVLPVAHNSLAMLTNYVSPEQRFVTCTNQDVTYGYGFLDNLDREPIVFQVPDFGDRFYVYALYDARTDEISNIGKQYGTKLGFYMVVGPNWKGLTPQGITAVLRSSTEVVATAPRVFIDDTPEDHAAVQPILSQIDFYSISKFDGKMKTVDQTRSMLETPQRYPRAGSQSYPTPAAAANLDGSTTVYFGPTKPTGVGDGNWIQTVPGKRWNTLLRFYSPLEPFFTKAWRPGEIEPQS